jgi:ribonucleoside-triphosphate reductase (formate)
MDENLIDTYIEKSTWRIKENSNQIFCVGHMMNFIASSGIFDYWMNNVFTKKIKRFHEEGRIHLHDMGKLCPYCSGFSTNEIVSKGLIGPKGRINSSPPKHLSSAINQLTNFVGIMSQEFAGAIALNDFSLYLAPFVYYDKLDYKQVKQEIQQFIFHMNQPNRWGSECPFTNITINLSVPSDMEDIPVFAGKFREKTYGEFEKEMNMINESILEVLIEGDATGTPLTFPVLTIGINGNFPWDSEISKKVFQVTAKYGTPFFENFSSGTGRDPSDTRSLCCRLSLSTKDLVKHTGGLFGSADSTGSIAVATINLNRIGYESKTEEEYFVKIEEAMEVCKDALELRRKTINEMYDKGLYVYTKFYLKNYKSYFSTIGIIGGNESMLNFMGKDISHPDAINFMLKVLSFMRGKCEEFSKETKNLYNLEAVPGEGAMYSLAIKDLKTYKDIILSGKDEKYLTSSTLPPVEQEDFVEMIKKQEPLQIGYTGGTALNIYIGEKLDNYIQAKNIVKKIIENTSIPYFSIQPTYSICKEHGYISGEKYRCPECNKACEVFSRVVGYLKPINQYNLGKREEYKLRKKYKISNLEELSPLDNK